MALIIGKSIGRYHILEQLGQGGMANVYKAFDTRLERELAVKVIRTELFGEAFIERILKRFEREAKALARLDHPNIIKVHDFGEYENAPYLVMQYVRSGTLKDVIGQPTPYQDAAKLLLPIAQALSYAHENGVLHRDVKPSNILITENNIPVLTDFGIAKLLEGEDGQTLTGTGMGVGTPEYMAPEQGLGKEVDARADIYALGVVFFELITGRKPYTADTPMAVIIKQIHEPLPRPKDYLPDLPDKVEKVLFKALTKDPENRYQNMEVFCKALSNLITLVMPVEDMQEQERRLVIVNKEIDEKGNEETRDEINISLEESGQPLLEDSTGKKTEKREIPEEKAHARKELSVWAWVGAWAILVMLFILLTIDDSEGQLQVSFLRSETPIPTKTSIPTRNSTATVPPTSTPGIGLTQVSEVDGMVQVYVPAGKFEMGSADEYSNEQPAHTVYLDAYWIDQTEVTNGMYEKCVEDGECTEPYNIRSYKRNAYYGNSQYEDYPVINVDWDQAQAYCEWAGRELPTEAKWEKAARGTDERTYPWGEGISSSLANYDFSVGDTTEVGSYKEGKSPYGAYDMAGNVWEWVSDWYAADYYGTTSASNSNPENTEESGYKVVRGGSWRHNEYYLRTASRWGNPVDPYFYVGFRCLTSEQ